MGFLNYTYDVSFEFSSNPYIINSWFMYLPDLIACDFEVASKYSDKIKKIYLNLANTSNKEMKRKYLQAYSSNGLSHPSLTNITHLSIATSPNSAYVAICHNENTRRLIYNFLVSTDIKQLWHNAIFDFKHIYYHTHQIPKNFIDTQLLSKCLLNNANSTYDNTGLKVLMASEYGEWAVAKDEFNLENQDDPRMLKYAATDACATYALYQKILKQRD